MPMAKDGPIVLATWSFGVAAVRAGWEVLQAGGSALDAVERGCVVVESDESVDSVGRGGIPDAAGRVTLDASIMVSPSRCAGVAGVGGFVHPISVARRVMEKTPHKLLVGRAAEDFAAAEGFSREELLTDAARAKWEAWREARGESKGRKLRDVSGANREERGKGHDTVGVLAMDAAGALAGACSTSGLGFKLPGRVGDSPIIGHGLYVDPRAGAAVATGRGELMMGVCATFLCCERMREGMAADEAVAFVLRRMREAYALTGEDQCGIIALRADGEWGCGALLDGFKVAVRSMAGEELREVG